MDYLDEIVNKTEERDACLKNCRKNFEEEKNGIIQDFKENLKNKSMEERTALLQTFSTHVNSEEILKYQKEVSSELGGIVWETLLNDMMETYANEENKNES